MKHPVDGKARTRKPLTILRELETATWRSACCFWQRLNNGSILHDPKCPTILLAELRRSLEQDRREVVEAARVWIERLATHLESAIEVIWNDGIDPGEDEVASERAIVTEALSFARSLSPRGTTYTSRLTVGPIPTAETVPTERKEP